MRHFFLFGLLIFLPGGLFSQALINEFSSSNSTGIKDEDGDYSDWIELYNQGTSAISLGGYHLTDDVNDLSKWTFPDVSLEPGAFQLIFASGKNRMELSDKYETIIRWGDTWKYLVPTAEPSTTWKNQGFDDSSWKSGPSGFGFGDNDDATVLNNAVSVYIRKEFTIQNLSEILEIILSIDYDDGFIAYINGKELARSSNLGAAGTLFPYNKTVNSGREALMYGGGLPLNFTLNNPTDYLVEGTNVIAIEVHNAATSSDLSLIPMLSFGMKGDGSVGSVPDYIRIPVKLFHTNFKISSSGETLVLSRPDLSVSDSVSSRILLTNISYGRKPDGSSSWNYFAVPTPGAANTSKGYENQAGDSVIFSYAGGYFPGGLQLKLSARNPADSILYTLDGSEPVRGSIFYTSPINLSVNTVVRAKVFNSVNLPGLPITNTYITKKHTLPVVCLSTDPANLWDYNTGIYELGPNADAAFPYFGANFWQDWERKAHMELYDVNGKKQVDQDVGIKIAGAYSRANAQKSMAIYARSGYGKGSLDYQFFKDKPISKFEAVLLRNAGNDWNQAIMRDGVTSILVGDMDVDRMAYQPTIVYLNAEYWGILNMREKVNSNFVAENHFVNPDSVNMVGPDGSIVAGSNAWFMTAIDYLNTHTLEAEADYLQVSNKIDIDNYIQYQLTEIYVNNHDWPGNNMKIWSTNNPTDLWRWILYDTDFGFSIWDTQAYNTNTLQFALETNGPNWPNPPWSTLFFRRMISNPGFRADFATQYADRLNTNFTSLNVQSVIDSIKNLLLPEINAHLLRWGMGYDNWISNLNIMNDYAVNRPAIARTNMRTELGLGTTLNVYVGLNKSGAGKVRVNTVIPATYPYKAIYFKNLPIRLTALPSPGYKFYGWEGTSHTNSPVVDFNMSTAGSFIADFNVASPSDINVVINEINYSSPAQADTKDWVELYNAGIATVDLKGWILSDGTADAGYVFPSELILYPGEYIVVCRDMAAFRLIHPKITNSTGNFQFGLGSNGDDVNLFNPDKVLVDWVNYTSNDPWPTDANGTGASIELVNPLADNNVGSNWNSSFDLGTPGQVNRWSYPLKNNDKIAEISTTLECFPNPFSDYTTIRVDSPNGGDYKLEIFDLQGRLVRILAEQNLAPGAYYIDWEGKDQNEELLPGGVYLVRLSGQKQVLNLKVVKME